MQTKEIRELQEQLEREGLKKGTPRYQREERSRKVELCKRLKDVGSCWECDYFDHCELVKSYLRDLHGAAQQKK